MAQTIVLNDIDVELTIDTSTSTNDLRVTDERGQKVVNAVRELKRQITTLKKVVWDIPGGGIIGRLGVWADSTPRIVYMSFDNLTLPSPNFYYTFINGEWTDAELGYLDKLKDAFLTFNSTHVLTSALGRSVEPDTLVPWGNLLAYWPLSESSGSRYDSYANYHLAEIGGTTPSASGKRGLAVVSDGIVKRLSATTTDFRLISRQMTVSLWVYVTSSLSPNLTFGLVVGGNGGSSDWVIRATYSSGNEIQCIMYTTISPVAEIATINLGQWHHVLAEYDTTIVDETVSMYFDNVFIGTSTAAPTAAPIVTSGEISVGTTFINASSGVMVDEIAIFDGFLTSDQRAALYNGGVGRFF